MGASPMRAYDCCMGEGAHATLLRYSASVWTLNARSIST